MDESACKQLIQGSNEIWSMRGGSKEPAKEEHSPASSEETEVPLYVHPADHFRLPEDSDAPMIMIGPGTGIAPFRAFIKHIYKNVTYIFFYYNSVTSLN